MRSTTRSPKFLAENSAFTRRVMRYVTLFPTAVAIVLVVPALHAKIPPTADAPGDTTVALEQRLAVGYGNLPMRFEANVGQTDSRVRFLARGNGYTLFLTPTEMALVSRADTNKGTAPVLETLDGERRSATPALLRIELVGANAAAPMTGIDELAGRSNYLIGNDESKWLTDVPAYARVRCEGVYPGIDVVYYGNPRQLEYDFVIAAGADPGLATLGFAVTDTLHVDRDGSLVIGRDAGEIRLRQPRAYQTVNAQQRDVPVRYALKNTHEVGFELGTYDKEEPLVIDPVVVYSTYLGGMGNESARAIAVDASGNAYVTGETLSADFPTTFGLGFQGGAIGDAFVTKLNAAGTGVVYSTYLGGTDDDQGLGIAVDGSGSAYVTGRTNSSTSFPTSAGALQPLYGGGADDAFVVKVNATGTALAYSTFLGGAAQDIGSGIAVDTGGNAYVAGSTTSDPFPTTLGSLAPSYRGGSSDGFVTKLDPAGSALLYSTYLGGTLSDFAFAIAVDSGNAFVTGQTNSTGLGTAGAAQSTFGGAIDAYVAKLNPTGSAFVYFTYVGGSGVEMGISVSVGNANNALVTGQTDSTNFPTTNGAYQTTIAGAIDGFVMRLKPGGDRAIYSTYIGGNSNDSVLGGALDSQGNAYVAGVTLSSNFPMASPLQGCTSGFDYDAFVTKFKPSGAGLVYSTCLGGSNWDQANGIAIDGAGNAYVTGFTNSSNFPTTTGAYSGGGDAFITKISK